MTRTRGREFALQVLYEIDTRGAEAAAALSAYWDNFLQAPGVEVPDASIREFTRGLVEGVVHNRAELDSLIERCSINWRIERMPRVDRNVIRLAAWELSHAKETPMKVVINEAIELGKRYGSEESGAFINGILDRVASELGRTA